MLKSLGNTQEKATFAARTSLFRPPSQKDIPCGQGEIFLSLCFLFLRGAVWESQLFHIFNIAEFSGH